MADGAFRAMNCTLPGDAPHIDNVLRAGELIVAIELAGTARHSAYLKLRERESSFDNSRPGRDR